MKAFIEAIRYALPEDVLDNDQLAEEFPGWTAEKIFAKTGIRERRVSAARECASDLAVQAAENLLEEAGCERNSIDFLLNCTVTPDYFLPTTACTLQQRLGLPEACGALDYHLGCSGYVYGLGLAKALLETGQARRILLITADTITKFIHPLDKSVRTLFGDAATATLIRANEAEEKESLTGPFVYGTDGSGAESLFVPAGGMRHPYEPDAEILRDDSGNARTINHLHQNGGAVFNFSLRVVPEAVRTLLSRAGASMDDVDLFVFHQANGFLLEHLRKKVGIPKEKFAWALEKVGNTASSSIPIALGQALEARRLLPGHLVMLVGFGVGFSWGATLIRWTE